MFIRDSAKTMSDVSKVKVPLTTVPRFQKEAYEIALQMSHFAVGDLERLLRVNAKIALENYKRYQAFQDVYKRQYPTRRGSCSI